MGSEGLTEFDRAARVTRTAEGRFSARSSAHWGGGGRPQGGFLAAQLLLAMQQSVSDPAHIPRSLSAQFLRSPEFGEYEVEVSVDRVGRTTTNLSGRITQGGQTMVQGLGTFGGEREGPELDELPMPAVEPPAPGRRHQLNLPAIYTEFQDQLVLQQRLGRPLFSEQGPMEIGGWMGFADPRPIDGAALCVLCDVMLMPLWVRTPRPPGTVTLDYSLHFRAPMPRSYEDELVFGQFRTRLVRGGYFDWDSVVWGRDGSVLCLARQQMLIVGP